MSATASPASTASVDERCMSTAGPSASADERCMSADEHCVSTDGTVSTF